MNYIENILLKLEECITNNKYEPLETEKIEIKDCSTSGEWKSIYESSNAFLNTEGGVIIIGIKEKNKNKAYKYTGYNDYVEPKIKKIPTFFKDDRNHSIDLSENFHYEIKDFLNGRVLLIHIEKLEEEKKYVFYNNKAYERKITGDHEISPEKIESHKEYKKEIENAKELSIVALAKLSDLDIDKLNVYIQLINRDIKIESLKMDIESARHFLERKKFIRNDDPTILGMLVCGRNIEDFLGGKCQVDCYVESSTEIAKNKKVYKNNIIQLMESSIGFILQNIETAISPEKGGMSIPEYPINLIRESVNNSLAHRSYDIDKYINININPAKYLEIRNPGSFKESLLILISEHESEIPIRRIIPGLPKAKNPRLADVLKDYNKWEGKGIGMATIVNECLENKIDLPYYKFHGNDDISLFIQNGMLLDDSMELLFDTYNGFIKEKLFGNELTIKQKLVFSYIYKSEIENKNYRYTILLTSDNNHFNVINTLRDSKLIFIHEKSPKNTPVYIVNREFIKNDFNSELITIYGNDYKDLPNDYKNVLQIIFQYNKYNKIKSVSANLIGNILYYRNNKKINNTKEFENFKRKIRAIVRKLNGENFIYKIDNYPNYSINHNFKKNKEKSLFDGL